MGYLENYFSKVLENDREKSVISFLAAIDAIKKNNPVIAESIIKELKDQRSFLKLIASENYSSLPVQLAMGNLLTDKYSEGVPSHRFYAGCDNVDTVEAEAIMLAKKIFNSDHAYVQPHSGADANILAYWSIIVEKVQTKEVEKFSKKNIDELTAQEYEDLRKIMTSQKIMGMSLNSGGHLTHGYRHNISSKMFRSVSYEVDPETFLINYSELERRVKEEKPTILVAGYSAYSRHIDFAKFREIADSVGATLLVDMAHFAGLVAGGVFTGNNNPVPFAHMVTSTTHKTLRGPRGGMILCKKEFTDVINKGCPLVLGGPLPHVMAAKAVAFKEVDSEAFCKYAHQIVKNAKVLAEELVKLGCDVLTKGTDNHLVLINVNKSFNLTGRQAEFALREANLTVNRNTVPNDQNGAWYTSGVRLGTAAITTLGMKEDDMKIIAKTIFEILKNSKPKFLEKKQIYSKAKVIIDPIILEKFQNEILEFLENFPLYPEIIL